MSESTRIPRQARRCVRHHYDASKKGPSHRIATGFSDNKGASRPKADAAALSGIFAAASRHRLKLRGPLRLEKASRLPMKIEPAE